MINSNKKGEPTKLLQGPWYIPSINGRYSSITQQYYVTGHKGCHFRGKYLTIMSV